jgi:glucose-6-phosphate 1-dehydrogenase
MPKVATSKPQTISYPAPGSRPNRYDDFAVDPHVVVLFGATGDLARRKLIPGLAYLDMSELAPNIEIVATSLEDISTDEFLKLAKSAIEDFGTHKLSKDQWTQFAETVTYVPQGAKRWPRPSPTPRPSWAPKSAACTIFRCHPRPPAR